MKHIPTLGGRETFAAALLLTIMLLLFFWPAVFAGRALVPTDLIFQLDPLWQPLAPEGFTFPGNRLLSDQVYQFYPWKLYIVESLADGRIPLWNPYINSGQPLLANAQTAIFSPFTLFSLLFPLHASFVATAIPCLFIAGLSTFLLAREIGIGKCGALVAMVAFTFSGPLIVLPAHPHIQALAWLPAMLFLTERALILAHSTAEGSEAAHSTAKGSEAAHSSGAPSKWRLGREKRSTLYMIATGVAIGAQFLAGHPETSFHMMLVWMSYSAYRIIELQGWRLSRSTVRLGIKVSAAVIIGLMISAVQLLPFLDFIQHSAILSMRATKPKPPLLSTLFLDWHTWPTAITALLPQFFGTPLNDSYWYPYSNYNEQTLYAGVLPLALAVVSVIGILKKRRSATKKGSSRPRFFFLGLAILSLGVGLRLPLFNLINKFPLFALATNDRLRDVYVLAIAILAGFGVDQVIDAVSSRPKGENPSPLRALMIILAVISLLSLLIITASHAGLVILKDRIIELGRSQAEAMVGHPLYPYSLEHYYRKVDALYQRMKALFHPRHPVMFLPIGIGLATFGLYRWLVKAGQRAQMWAMSLILLIFLDLFFIGASYNPTIESEHIYPTPGAIQFLQQEEKEEIYRVAGLGLTLMPNSGMVYHISDVRGYDAVAPKRYMDLFGQIEGSARVTLFWLLKEADSPLLDLLNVKYILTEQNLGGRWEQVYQDDDGMRVYQNRTVMPRAFVVHQAQYVDSAEESLARLTGGQVDYRKTAILEGGPIRGIRLPDESAPTFTEVHITHYEPERVEVQTNTSADGILVLTDGHDPGWRAELDGQPSKIYVANHAFRAVALPAGEHQVTFLYDPSAFKIGLGISLFACGSVVAAVVGLFLGSRHPTPRENREK